MSNSAFPARLKTIALVLILAVLVAGCANVRRGVSWPALDTIEMDGSTAVVVAYEKQIDIINPDLPLSLVDNGTETGWQVNGSDYEDAQFFTPPVRFNDPDDDVTTLFFPTYNNRMLEFNLQTAAPTTTVGIALDDGVIAVPVIANNLIYVPYRTQDLVALDTGDYAEQWRLETEGGIWSSPVLVEDTLYVGSIDHHIYALDAISGDVIWSADLEGAVAASPLYHDGYLYAGSYSRSMYKIDATDGTIVSKNEGDGWVWSTPVIHNDVLYYTDLSGTVYALDPDNFNAIWKSTVADSGSRRGIRPAPIVTDEFVIVASRNGVVYWLDPATGETIFDREVDGAPELLSDMLLLEAGTVEGVSEALIVVGSTDNKRLVAFYQLDTSQPYEIYDR